jgi:hypothetical protein
MSAEVEAVETDDAHPSWDETSLFKVDKPWDIWLRNVFQE